jgi:hypothetical protein
MARSSQYKYMNEESIGPALLCIICKRPFKDARCTPCNHIFCHECIIRWMGVNRASCPACHKIVSADNLSQISHTLNNMLGTLRVKCTLCGETELLRENFDDHIRQACPNAPMSCLSPDINYPWIGQQRQLNNHLPTCTLHFHPFLSVFTELFHENRQLTQQCQQQMSQIQEFRTESQRQKTEIERVDQRCNQHEAQLKELRGQLAGKKMEGVHR